MIVSDSDTNLVVVADGEDQTNKQHQLIVDKLTQSLNRTYTAQTPLTAETFRILRLSSSKFDNLPFENRFDLIFNDSSMLRAAAIQGILDRTNLRCLAWMIFLGCLPMDRSRWIDELKNKRDTYEQIRALFHCDPQNDDQHDHHHHHIDHPLSQENHSIWSKYFDHNELKALIVQDVNRIHRFSDFFKEQSTLDLIVNLLFLYVKFTQNEYKQGMHELLACIIYVLHKEYDQLTKMNMNDSNHIVNKIADMNYLEHDSFILFFSLMGTIYHWFGINRSVSDSSSKFFSSSAADKSNTNSPDRTSSRYRSNSMLTVNPRLFVEEDNEPCESYIIHKINYIMGSLLRNNDIEVYNHLIKNDVSLHPFGIRWLRLLYLRELNFPASLVIWDSIFAVDSRNFSLADYIFIAILGSLRGEILSMDNSECLRLLMQPQIFLDPAEVLKTALYLQSPAVYARPLSMDNTFEIVRPFQSMINTSTTTTTPPSRLSDSFTQLNVHNTTPLSSSSMSTSMPNSNSQMFNQNNRNMQRLTTNTNNPFDVGVVRHERSKHLPNHNNNEMRVDEREMAVRRLHQENFNEKLMETYKNQVNELEEQNVNLITELQNMRQTCRSCSQSIDDFVDLFLQKVLPNLADDSKQQMKTSLENLIRARNQLVASETTIPENSNNNKNNSKNSITTTNPLDHNSNNTTDSYHHPLYDAATDI